MKEQRPKTRRAREQPARDKQPRNPPAMAAGWGRGASEHRPGLFTREYLAAHGEASCADVFAALRENLDLINRERVEIGEKPIRGCTYSSFARYFHWFKLLGLIEPTGETEPAIYEFLRQKQPYRLTSQGGVEDAAWEDPVRAAHPEFR